MHGRKTVNHGSSLVPATLEIPPQNHPIMRLTLPLFHKGLNLTANTVRINVGIESQLTSSVNIALINFGVSASLPISIAPSPRDHAEGGPPDDQHAKPEHALPSTSYRRASYAARDRSRSLDPGALDFEPAGDDDGIDTDDGDTGSLSRGRRHALKILQARSELPAEGMWRSLAS